MVNPSGPLVYPPDTETAESQMERRAAFHRGTVNAFYLPAELRAKAQARVDAALAALEAFKSSQPMSLDPQDVERIVNAVSERRTLSDAEVQRIAQAVCKLAGKELWDWAKYAFLGACIVAALLKWLFGWTVL